MQFPGPVDPFLLRVAALVLIIAGAAALGQWWRRTGGRPRAVDSEARLTAGDLGVALGARATLLQFSSPTCAPCRAAHRVLAAVAEAPGVVHVELDAGEHLALTRRLGVLRTPTVFVLTPSGRIVARASGVPTHPQLAEALALAGGA